MPNWSRYTFSTEPASSDSKGGGWISALIAGLAIQLIILLMWLFLKRFPDADMYECLYAIW